MITVISLLEGTNLAFRHQDFHHALREMAVFQCSQSGPCEMFFLHGFQGCCKFKKESGCGMFL